MAFGCRFFLVSILILILILILSSCYTPTTMFWKTVFIHPLANALILFVGIFGGNVGLGIAALTVVVKLILSPLSYKATIYQIEQKKLQPLIKKIQSDYPDKTEQSKKMMELYKEHKTNPFAGCLVVLIQLPIIIALYRVILDGAAAFQGALYPFITMPETISAVFLGMNLAEKSIILAILAGVTQFIQMQLSPSFKKDLTDKSAVVGGKPEMAYMMSSMQSSMKYSMPIMMVVLGIVLPGAITLYLVVSNLFTLVQEQIIIKMLEKRGIKV